MSKKVHLNSKEKYHDTSCGLIENNPDFLTNDPDKVTCGNCKYTKEYEEVKETKKLGEAMWGHQDKDSSAKEKQVGGSWYKKFEIQPIEFVLENGDQLHANDAFILNNVLKYLMRHREKNGKEDLEKAEHYIQLLKEHEYD